HGELALLPLRHRSARLERRMSDVGYRVSLFELLVGLRKTFGNRAARICRLRLGRLLSQVIEKLFSRRLLLRLPFDFDRGSGAMRIVFAGRGDSDEVAVANDFDLRHSFGFAYVRGNQSRVERGGPDYFAKQHIRQLQVGCVAVLTSNEISAVDLGD